MRGPIKPIAAIVILLVAVVPVVAMAADAHIVGYRPWNDNYNGTESLISAQDPENIYADDSYVSTFLAATGGYIRAGNYKNDDLPNNCDTKPFFWYIDWLGSYWENSAIPKDCLVAATYYKYSIYPSTPSGYYNIRFCYGSGFSICPHWGGGLAVRTGFAYYQDVGTGGDAFSPSTYAPIGYSAVRANRLRWQQGGNAWQSYCYVVPQGVVNTVAWDGGILHNCVNSDWAVEYR